MFPKKEPLVELKNLRENFGNDQTAINKHSVRYYRKGKQVFMLDKTLDGVPPFYSLSEVPKSNHSGNPMLGRRIHMDGKEYWGSGFSWADAERAIMELLDASCIQRDHEVEKLEFALVSGK
jgi:hypothetical protein